jgi:AmiR/NasT family two-component response regulator
MSFTHSAKVFRAAKLVSEQTGCRLDEALALIHERAVEAQVSIDEIAASVLDRVIRFDA